MSDAVATLKHLGMSEYESKAYVTLLGNGLLSAEAISRLGTIPLPRVYDTMQALAKKGLVVVSKTRPQTFRSVPPDKLSRLLKDEEQSKLENRLKVIENLVPKFIKEIPIIRNTSEEPDTGILLVQRKSNMEDLWNNLLKNATEEVLIFAGNLSWVHKNEKHLKALKRRRIKFKILWSKKTEGSSGRVKKLISLGADIRFSPKVGKLRGFVVDRKLVSVSRILKPNKFRGEADMRLSESETEFNTLVINDGTLASVFGGYFDSLWKTGKK